MDLAMNEEQGGCGWRHRLSEPFGVDQATPKGL
jgi:hypothetical protein